jgi:hypothetical protein
MLLTVAYKISGSTLGQRTDNAIFKMGKLNVNHLSDVKA